MQSNASNIYMKSEQAAHALPPLISGALPEPTHTFPDASKKSHARKQPRGHVPRPRNAFILFRCDFVRQKKIPQDVEKDHRNISRIVGQIWRQMSDIDKAPWVAMAEKEKALHHQTYPGYRYTPMHSNAISALTKKKRGEVSDVLSRLPSPYVPSDISPMLARRSSSCPPPGSAPVTLADDSYASPMSTRDDLSRRPSRVVMYKSTNPSAQTTERSPGSFAVSRADSHTNYNPLMNGPYAIEPPKKAPGWDAAPPPPQPWSDVVGSGMDISPLHWNNKGYTPLGIELFQPAPLFTNPFADGDPIDAWLKSKEYQEIDAHMQLLFTISPPHPTPEELINMNRPPSPCNNRYKPEPVNRSRPPYPNRQEVDFQDAAKRLQRISLGDAPNMSKTSTGERHLERARNIIGHRDIQMSRMQRPRTTIVFKPVGRHNPDRDG